MRLVMLGLPGAGKGTQAKLLEKRFGMLHVSTGDMFREAIKSGAPMGRKAQEFMARGELVPDDVAIEIVKRRLQMEDCREGYILDGFPRTVSQAEALDDAVRQLGQPIEAVINIRISDDEAIRRIAERRICSQCGAIHPASEASETGENEYDACGGLLVQRADDNVETARHRLKVYFRQTHPLLDYYMQRGMLIDVDGEQEIESVYRDAVQALVEAGIVPQKSSGVWG